MGSEAIFTPFYFDGNSFFGEVRGVQGWLVLCERYRNYFSHLGERENRIRLMREARATSITQNVEQGVAFRPGWHDLPNFGLRREHTEQNLTLEAWLQKHGMYETLLDAESDESETPD